MSAATYTDIGKMSGHRSYQLLIEVRHPIRCVIGRLGAFEFPAGCYTYTGSAKRGLEARISRHLRRKKAVHWHVDFLLGAPGVKITKVTRSCCDECRLNQVSPGKILVPGFGSSDCRAGCGSHLKYIG